MKNKLISFFLAFCMMLAYLNFSVSADNSYAWADTYMEFCKKTGIISGDENGNLMPGSNLTREQMAKILLNTFFIDMDVIYGSIYDDVKPDRWSYKYISKYTEYALEVEKSFKPTENVTREEFLAMTVKISGYDAVNLQNKDILKEKFLDEERISDLYYDLISIGCENGFIEGSDGMLRPKDTLTRAEACSLIYKILNKTQDTITDEKEEEKEEEIIKYPLTTTSIIGNSEATLLQAKQWAKNKNAPQTFIDAADLYWKYGELSGIRADMLYAQAAKETAYGKYTGKVKPEQNNFAGIKKYGVTGDAPEDHEDFLTVDDGVRGHFNHMSAYVGLAPIGVPHGRFNSVASLSWAGTIKNVEELGKKWCPDINYGYSVLNDYLLPMTNTKVVDDFFVSDVNSSENIENNTATDTETETTDNLSKTYIIGESEVALEQAKIWAKNRNATGEFISAADIYWKYGELTGIRPDILYAQAAKETGCGKYGGIVNSEQNNFAGIKKYGATGDTTDDFETFETPDDGVRGHFNHICAYVGLEPIGTPHGRYNSVVTTSWAGTIKTVEELTGKWATNPQYGISIINDYLLPMKSTKVD